ncbi:type III-B CRISPR module RAMP protein Cmr4 [uncultured Thiodictyon sp.]|jgi:CRISPR-associated protein Cmr4|uniref:type III-B CRISPR module RAMP protein Cmr4 n=1 Tax=uncultured Thiodictyon sp. TaxID=1846217 RepID=UPI0025EFD0FB|nr:type III-B CRISPR module RAMP protein Cmr4 [uncultured Thiodictyon sp.]
MQPRLFHLHALSALHCGTGQSTGVVDLPIARARATQLPIVPGSSLRGVLRQQVTEHHPEAAPLLFGPQSIDGKTDSFAGALAVGDAHLLTLPVRALAGIVCFASSPFILRRYAQDLARTGYDAPPLPPAQGGETALVAADSVNLLDDKLVLEDLDLTARGDKDVTAWAETIARTLHPSDADGQRDFIQRFALLPDDIFGFLAETATEVRARIAIDERTGTVKKGALWYEENLPAESVLWGLFALSGSNDRNDRRTANDLAPCLPATGTLLQLGGKAGVGRGLVRLVTAQVTQ